MDAQGSETKSALFHTAKHSICQRLTGVRGPASPVVTHIYALQLAWVPQVVHIYFPLGEYGQPMAVEVNSVNMSIPKMFVIDMNLRKGKCESIWYQA